MPQPGPVLLKDGFLLEIVEIRKFFVHSEAT
jgi:hypothetical protein